MPTITRQKVTNRLPQPPSPNGSILSQGIAVADLADDYQKVVIYGLNRAGKTTLACQFPKPLLLISFESGPAGGAKSVKKIPGVTYLRIQTTAQAIQLAKELAADRTYKTHVLDTVTSCQDLVLQELLGLEAAPVQLNWGLVTGDQYRERSEKTREVLRPFKDLPAHTVFVAQEKDHNPPLDRAEKSRAKLTGGLQMESFFAADLGGATVKWLHDACDHIGRLYVAKEVKTVVTKYKVAGKEHIKTEEHETGRNVRRLLTMLQPNFAAGIRSENPEAVPEYIEAVTPAEMYVKLQKVIQGIKIA